MATQIQIRRDTAANWASINPILAEGEQGLEKDTGKIKIGDGINLWQNLNYLNEGGTWGSITGTLTNQTDLITALNGKVAANDEITGATKTKITYDAKGLVIAGADASTADIAASTDKNYVTDAQLAVIQNTSGINTGDQTLAGLGGVPTSRTVNGQALSADITIKASDVGLGNVTNDAQLKRSANDFSAFKQKSAPVSDDLFLIEDSADSGAKKYITLGSLPSPDNQSNLNSIDQNLGTSNQPTFAGLTINGNITVSGTVDGVDVSSHNARHVSGGPDAITGNLDANARLQVKASGTTAGTRRAINFIPGANVSLTVTDDPANETVNITIAANAGASDSGLGTMQGTAGEALSAYDLCYLNSDGTYHKANAGTVTTMPGLVLAGSDFSAAQAGSFIRRGQIVNKNWSWGTIGGFVYADPATAGALTQTLPSQSGNQVQIVGVALSATQIDFDPQLVLVEVA